MHGVSEQDEIAYWRERAEKAERERDEARLVAATSERESIAYREHLSTLSWAATELRRLEGISVDDTQIATLVVDHARMRDENERLTRERDEARKLAADMAKELATERVKLSKPWTCTINELKAERDRLRDLIGDTLAYLRGSQVTLRSGVVARFSDLIGPALIDRLLAVAPSDVKAKFAAEPPLAIDASTPSTPIDEMLANLVGELHQHRNAPTDVQGIASTVERLISMTHALAIAANDTRERVLKLEQRTKDTDR